MPGFGLGRQRSLLTVDDCWKCWGDTDTIAIRSIPFKPRGSCPPRRCSWISRWPLLLFCACVSREACLQRPLDQKVPSPREKPRRPRLVATTMTQVPLLKKRTRSMSSHLRLDTIHGLGLKRLSTFSSVSSTVPSDFRRTRLKMSSMIYSRIGGLGRRLFSGKRSTKCQVWMLKINQGRSRVSFGITLFEKSLRFVG